MTPQEKNKMLELRRSGVSIKDIADQYGISISMAKKTLYSVKPNEIYCIVCGHPAKMGPRGTKFCCAKCKRQYYREHPGYVKHVKMHKGVCKHCGKEFEYYGRSHQEFCSKSCARKHYFVKRKQR